MHKNTFILVIFLSVFAVIITFVNLRPRSSAPITSLPTPTLAPTVSPTPSMLSYSSNNCGISFQYPASFTTVEIPTGGVTIVNTENQSISALCLVTIPNSSLPATTPQSIRIGTVSASVYDNRVIFTHPGNKKIIDLSTRNYPIDEVVSSLTLIP